MNPLSEFIVSTSSALTVMLLLYLIRQIMKLRKTAERLMGEHRYLMRTMQLVLQHIGLTTLIRQNDDK